MVSTITPETATEAILQARAESLAQSKESDLATLQLRRLVVFRLGQESFGIDIAHAREIQPLTDVTIIPCTPSWVVGAVNIRGTVTTVIDARRFFQMGPRAGLTTSKVMVINCCDMEFGIVADEVSDVIDVPTGSIQPPLATMAGVREEYISGVGPDMLVILDVEAIAKDNRLTIHEEIS